MEVSNTSFKTFCEIHIDTNDDRVLSDAEINAFASSPALTGGLPKLQYGIVKYLNALNITTNPGTQINIDNFNLAPFTNEAGGLIRSKFYTASSDILAQDRSILDYFNAGQFGDVQVGNADANRIELDFRTNYEASGLAGDDTFTLSNSNTNFGGVVKGDEGTDTFVIAPTSSISGFGNIQTSKDTNGNILVTAKNSNKLLARLQGVERISINGEVRNINGDGSIGSVAKDWAVLSNDADTATVNFANYPGISGWAGDDVFTLDYTTTNSNGTIHGDDGSDTLRINNVDSLSDLAFNFIPATDAVASYMQILDKKNNRVVANVRGIERIEVGDETVTLNGTTNQFGWAGANDDDNDVIVNFASTPAYSGQGGKDVFRVTVKSDSPSGRIHGDAGEDTVIFRPEDYPELTLENLTLTTVTTGAETITHVLCQGKKIAELKDVEFVQIGGKRKEVSTGTISDAVIDDSPDLEEPEVEEEDEDEDEDNDSNSSSWSDSLTKILPFLVMFMFLNKQNTQQPAAPPTPPPVKSDPFELYRLMQQFPRTF